MVILGEQLCLNVSCMYVHEYVHEMHSLIL